MYDFSTWPFFLLYVNMIVVSHTGSRGLHIFVICLETVKVLLGPNFWNVFVYMSFYHIRTEIYFKLNLKKIYDLQ